MPTVTANSSIRITKGCKALGIVKDDIATVLEVRPMGADWGHSVRVTIKVLGGKTCVLWARHMNRLSDDVVRLHNGAPTKNIEFFVRPVKAPTGAVARVAPSPLAIRMMARARVCFGSTKVTIL